MKKRVELLSPAGSMTALKGAINAGANAIYLGGEKFGARAYANNFSEDELLYCIQYAHLFDVKIYLTVNTLVKELEFSQIYDYLAPLYEKGLDGVIVQDIGVFMYIKENFPKLELHVSTQMALTGKYSVAYLKELGASRVVPARELSLAEIVDIKDECNIEIEAFVHGAMCYSYSGQCLFSSILGGRSGNRGRCAQPCRLPYKVTSIKKDNKINKTDDYYPLSLKDMCTIDYIEQLIEAGIDSFKIEGRMKKPEYAAGVTSIYRKYIDNKGKISIKDRKILSNLYLRSEIENGYYFQQNGKNMITIDSPTYSENDEKILQEIKEKYLDKNIKKRISIDALFLKNEVARLTFYHNDLVVSIEGKLVEEAQKAPITEEIIRKQLGKIGDTVFEIDNLSITLDTNIFYSLKEINELRRSGIALLEKEIIDNYQLPQNRILNKKEEMPKNSESIYSSENLENAYSLLITRLEQLDAIAEYSDNNELFEEKIKNIYIEFGLLVSEKENVLYQVRVLKEKYKKLNLGIGLPHIMRKNNEKKIKEILELGKEHFSIALIRNMETYAYVKNCYKTYKIYLDSSMYIWNKKSREFWSKEVEMISVPYELNKKEVRDVFLQGNYEKNIYGRIPMMITANCVAKTTNGCCNKRELYQLKDRYQKSFPVILECDSCYNIIYNSLPLSLHKELSKNIQNYLKRISFTTEKKEETEKILKYFLYEDYKKQQEFPTSEYTTGHEKRGVE